MYRTTSFGAVILHLNPFYSKVKGKASLDRPWRSQEIRLRNFMTIGTWWW